MLHFKVSKSLNIAYTVCFKNLKNLGKQNQNSLHSWIPPYKQKLTENDLSNIPVFLFTVRLYGSSTIVSSHPPDVNVCPKVQLCRMTVIGCQETCWLTDCSWIQTLEDDSDSIQQLSGVGSDSERQSDPNLCLFIQSRNKRQPSCPCGNNTIWTWKPVWVSVQHSASWLHCVWRPCQKARWGKQK